MPLSIRSPFSHECGMFLRSWKYSFLIWSHRYLSPLWSLSSVLPPLPFFPIGSGQFLRFSSTPQPPASSPSLMRSTPKLFLILEAVTKQVEIFQVQVSSISGDFCLNTEVTKVDKNQLLSLENPRYEQCLAKYSHLKGIEKEDKDSKDILPVHLILGASDYTKIKTETAPRVRALGEPIGDKTKLG